MHNEITMLRAKSSVIIWFNQGRVNEFYKQYQIRINTIMDNIKAIQSRYFEMENGKPKMIDVYDGEGDDKKLVKKEPVLLIGKTIEQCQSYGWSVNSFEWVKSFGAARNANLTACTTRWYVWMDSDDLIAIFKYLRMLPYVNPDAIGAIGVSHSGEMILKVAAEMDFAAGVAIEGASHEFISVETGPTAPRKGTEIQYQDIEVVRKNADKAKAMARIRRINTPILHLARDRDHLQGIFQLVHEWMLEAGKDSTLVSFDHPSHGYPYIYRKPDGSYQPEPIQQQAYDLFMAFFDRHLKGVA